MDAISPLVSVGIPTYNRPDGLSKTLECITKQTYQNLEIIISDNCSTDPETALIARNYSLKDQRVKYHRQQKNIGPLPNFEVVLEKATGTYFMWAADDDQWDLDFIEECVRLLEEKSNIVAVHFETQYIRDENNCYPFFPEGVPFYTFFSCSKILRVLHMLRNNYGNLFYSMYKREILFDRRKSCLQTMGLTSLNEIPLFIYVASKGNWKIVPQVKFYKSPPSYESYLQAKWESTGGKFYPMKIPYYRSVFFYHLSAFADIVRTMKKINLPHYLAIPALMFLTTHIIYLSIGWKPRRKVDK